MQNNIHSVNCVDEEVGPDTEITNNQEDAQQRHHHKIRKTRLGGVDQTHMVDATAPES